MSTRTLVCLTNIPTPYRLFQFGLMCEHLERRGWNFEVWFMARSQPERNWNFSKGEFAFRHRFLRGMRVGIGSVPLHLNPGVIRILRDVRPDILLVAGGWANPTVWLASTSSASPRKIFWSESHLSSIQRRGITARLARQFALGRFTEFALPGVLAEQYIRHHTRPTLIHHLPNLVDPAIFRDEVARVRRSLHKSPEAKRMLLISARLAPEKGLLQFLAGFRRIYRASRERVTICIAGTGRLLGELQKYIDCHSLPVRLTGYQTESEMVDLYGQADGFCLPSISDPNPISVIEALWAGLPLLLSSRVGNHPECVRDGENGFLFDALNPNSIADAISRWLELSPNELSAFGKRSREIAHQEFDPDRVIKRFLDELIPATYDSVPLSERVACGR